MFSPALRLIVLCIVFVFICSSLPDTFYHRLVSLTFLLIRFARMTSRKFTTELNNPTAAEKEYCLSTRPMRYT